MSAAAAGRFCTACRCAARRSCVRETRFRLEIPSCGWRSRQAQQPCWRLRVNRRPLCRRRRLRPPISSRLHLHLRNLLYRHLINHPHMGNLLHRHPINRLRLGNLVRCRPISRLHLHLRNLPRRLTSPVSSGTGWLSAASSAPCRAAISGNGADPGVAAAPSFITHRHHPRHCGHVSADRRRRSRVDHWSVAQPPWTCRAPIF